MIKKRYNDIDFYKVPSREFVLMAIAKAVFLLYTLVIPFSLHGFSHALGLVGLFVIVNGNIFILNFAVNHLLEDNVFPDRELTERDWAKLQVRDPRKTPD